MRTLPLVNKKKMLGILRFMTDFAIATKIWWHFSYQEKSVKQKTEM